MAELDLRLDLRPTARGALIVLAGLLLCLPEDLASENVTLSATYPPVVGVYSNLLATGNTMLATQGGYVDVGTKVAPSNSTQLYVVGRVGIGNAAPGDMLEVDSPGAGGGVVVGGANPGVQFGGPVTCIGAGTVLGMGCWGGVGGANDVVLRSAGPIDIGGGGVIVNQNGLGVGGAPSAALDVNGDFLGRSWQMSLESIPTCAPGSCPVACQIPCPPGQVWSVAACACQARPMCTRGNCPPSCDPGCAPGWIFNFVTCRCQFVRTGRFGCFAEGSRVLTPSGARAIEDIRPGDLVYSVDPKSYALIAHRVAEVEDRTVTDVLAVTLSNGTTLHVTAVHRFFDPRSGQFKPISQFKAGDALAVLRLPDSASSGALAIANERPASGEAAARPAMEWDATIASIVSVLPRSTVVHNLLLEAPFQNYIVDGALVHSVSPGPE